MHSRACRLASRRFTAAAPLSLSNISPNVIAAQYAVRGEIVQCAMEHASALARGEPRPFKSLLYCNIGNPQDLGQQPLTFFRQVLALANWSELLSPANAAHAGALFPADAMARARRYTEASVVGAYSHSQGIPLVREEVAEFLRERDGVHANASDLFLTDGASPAARMLMSLLIRGPKDGVMVPVPQYPLYSATIALHAGKRVDYFLKEEKCWSLEVSREPAPPFLLHAPLTSPLPPPLSHPSAPLPQDGGA
jgi:alanine transaminase